MTYQRHHLRRVLSAITLGVGVFGGLVFGTTSVAAGTANAQATISASKTTTVAWVGATQAAGTIAINLPVQGLFTASITLQATNTVTGTPNVVWSNAVVTSTGAVTRNTVAGLGTTAIVIHVTHKPTSYTATILIHTIRYTTDATGKKPRKILVTPAATVLSFTPTSITNASYPTKTTTSLAGCQTTTGTPLLQLSTPNVFDNLVTINGVVVVPQGDKLTGINWNWGDGTASAGCYYFPQSHTYARPGSYTVTVSTTFTSGAQLQASANVQISFAASIATPSDVTAVPGDGQAALGWVESSTKGASAIAGYVIQPITNTHPVGAPITDASTATTYTIAGLSDGETYTFDVAARTIDGTLGAFSRPSNLVTPRASPSVRITPTSLRVGATTYTSPISSVPLEVTNTGTEPLQFQGDPSFTGSSPGNFGAAFPDSGAAGTCTLSFVLFPDESCSFVVSFDPTAGFGGSGVARTFSATMTVFLDDSVSASVAVSGTGTPMAVTSVAIVAQVNPLIVVDGHGFGSGFPPNELGVASDTPYLLLQDNTAHWSAGYSGYNDSCHVAVQSWTNDQVIFQAFVGGPLEALAGCPYSISSGNSMLMELWNPGNMRLSAEKVVTALTPASAVYPEVAHVAPNTGSVNGGTVVTISGSAFGSASAVLFGGVPGTDLSINASGTTITVTTPPSSSAQGVEVKVLGQDGVASDAGCWIIQDCAAAFFYTSPALLVPMSNPISLAWTSPDYSLTIDNTTVALSGAVSASFVGQVDYSSNNGVPSAVIATGTLTIKHAAITAKLETVSISKQTGLLEIPLPLGLPEGLDAYVTVDGSLTGSILTEVGITDVSYTFSGLGVANGVQLGSGSLSCSGRSVTNILGFLGCANVTVSTSASASLVVSPLWLQAGFDVSDVGSLDAGIGPQLGVGLQGSVTDTFSIAHPIGTPAVTLEGEACLSVLEWHASATVASYGATEGGPIIGPFDLAGNDPSACPLTPTGISASATSTTFGTLTVSADPPATAGVPTLFDGFLGLDPAGLPSFSSNGTYFYLGAANGSVISRASVKVCGQGGASAVWWWGGRTWIRVGGVVVTSQSPTTTVTCLSFGLTDASQPSASSLDAPAYFALGSPSPVPPPPSPRVSVRRIYGPTADATAAAELASVYPPGQVCPGTASTRPVVLATDATFPDALSSAYLAEHLSTGTLLTPSSSLSGVTTEALRNDGITHVYVVGGPLAISTSVVTALKALPAYDCGGRMRTGADLSVTRIFGETEYATAQDIATFLGAGAVGTVDLQGAYGKTNATGGVGLYNMTAGNGSLAASGPGALRTAIVATGTGFQDAESAATLSYAGHFPLLLTTPSALSPEAATAIKVLGITQVVVMGGPFAVSDAVVTSLESLGVSVLRVGGATDTQSAIELAQMELASAGNHLGTGWAPTDGVTVARGDFYSDGLAGAVVAAHGGATGHSPEPMLLTEDPTVPGNPLLGFLAQAGASGIDHDSHRVTSLTVLGGPEAVTPAAVSSMEAALDR